MPDMGNIIYFTRFSEASHDDELERFTALLSSGKQAAIRGIRSAAKRRAVLVSELIVRSAIYRTCGISNKEILFAANAYHKPLLLNKTDFHFNISHSEDAASVMISNVPVGIDIEKLRMIDDGRISGRFYTTKEISYINEAQEDEERRRRFFMIWTRKEAYIKCVGKGLLIPLRSFDVLSEEMDAKTQTFQKDGYIVSFHTPEYQNRQYCLIDLTERDIRDMAAELQDSENDDSL